MPMITKKVMTKNTIYTMQKLLVICFIESPLKMMKNTFYYILKAPFVLKVFRFCHGYLVMQEKKLDQKDNVYFFRFMQK